jgi:ABC-type glutathione transport system ATPase component
MIARMTDELRIPIAVRAPTSAVIDITDAACSDHLDEEYGRLARRLVGRLARKRPSPLIRGDPRIWAAGVLYVIGQINFLFDRTQQPHLTAASGGQQQRVAIARAMVTRPSILFADEPTGNLDSRAGRGVLELLRECADSFRQTILTVTHEPRVSSIADRILLLADGLIVDELDHVSSGEVRGAIDALAT